ncbi:hypothetical protein COOONC_09717 [Cooperia oncophora]
MYEQVGNFREVLEHTNDSVNRALLYYMMFVMFFMMILGMILYGMKLHYRVKLADELDKIRQDKEPGRVFYVEAGSGAQRIVPAPLSPPLTDHQIYNPVGEMLVDDARRAAI